LEECEDRRLRRSLRIMLRCLDLILEVKGSYNNLGKMLKQENDIIQLLEVL
jgi:hypothetical protein